ncbi:MAG: ATP-grasp domain-containing protein [Candidatus Pacebacteria bacterium]|nr:ATP-grasp domain-containing protein [Candidatus Paceibacterota bacterium]
MSKIRVGVLRGGTSREYEKSLKSGANVLKNLPEKYVGYDILITKDGTWHFQGLPIIPEKLFPRIDVIFNALIVGNYSENAQVEHIFESHNIPYTGGDPLSSVLSRNKALTKRILEKHGIKTPHSIVMHKDEYNENRIMEIFRSFPMPAVVKPVSDSLSRGVSLAKTLQELKESLRYVFLHSPIALIEEYIKGKDAKCIVVENFRGKKYYSFFPIEVRKSKGIEFINSEMRAEEILERASPGNFTKKEKEKMEKVSAQAHQILGIRHISKTDFVVHPRRGVYLLEIDPLQGFSENTSIAHSLSVVGAKMSDLIEHLIELARKN